MNHITRTISRIDPATALRATAKPVVFAVLLALATMAGRIPIPGTPVPITLQTFVLMLAALTMTWRQAAGAVALYLAAGAAGMPVFSGGMATAALFGPNAGFLIGFLPGVIVTAWLKGHAGDLAGTAATPSAGTPAAARRLIAAALRTLRYFAASIIGCVVVVYAFGFTVQSALTGVPLSAVALASMGFVAGDLVKAAVAALAIGVATRR